MKYSKLIYIILITLVGVSCTKEQEQLKDKFLIDFVDPFIGTGGHGHVFLGANVPYGFVQLGPTQYSQGWDWCSGYHYSDSTIIGFSHQHLSGTGIGELGDVSLMPVIGNVKTTRGELPDDTSGIYSYFSHDNEKAEPGYYSVLLDRFGISAELTATNRVGFHRYTFPESEDARIIVDLEHGIGWDQPTEGYIIQENDSVLSGYRKSKGWAKDQEVYFTINFSKPFKDFIVSDGLEQKEGKSIRAKKAYGQALFDTDIDEEILVKVALSPVSIENAKMNMQAELPHWNFTEVVDNAQQTWNEGLNKIEADFQTEEEKKIFYTALYHTMFFPCTYSDVDGSYRGADYKVHQDSTFNNLTVFSLWDTYRAAFPLVSITNKEFASDIAQTMIKIYEQQGKLPIWHLANNETYCMVGNPAICILSDYYLKGIPMDKAKAYEAMVVSTNVDERGQEWLKEYGYIPFDKDKTFETVAKGMEFAIADGALAEVAKHEGKTEDYNHFLKRSKAYKHYFDPKTQFVRGLSSEGKFNEPFDPIRNKHMEDDYTEGNAWQYTWLAPHDISGLIELFGGTENFTTKLDSLFTIDVDTIKLSNDITGLIGLYAHGNEPSHHISYIYPYINQPWKASDKIRTILSDFYLADPSGICGNEDVGQMSSWYILSALGFYQVEPAGGKFVFGSPIVKNASINVGDSKTFSIQTINNSPENKYIQSVKLNGKPYNKYYINHEDIIKGGTLEFTMGNKSGVVYYDEVVY